MLKKLKILKLSTIASSQDFPKPVIFSREAMHSPPWPPSE